MTLETAGRKKTGELKGFFDALMMNPLLRPRCVEVRWRVSATPSSCEEAFNAW